MIIKGGSRSGADQLAAHLLRKGKDSNEQVEVIELHHFATGKDALGTAFRDWEVMCSGTRGSRGLYHANIDPDQDVTMTVEQWTEAVNTLERKLGLTGQPRAVVQHQKHGRTHRHVVWCRTNIKTMTLIRDSWNYLRHEEASGELEDNFEHKPVPGKHAKRNRALQPEFPRQQFTQFEWVQAQRAGIDPRQRKALITEIHRGCETGLAFVAALAKEGYLVARGDKRDFVVVNERGHVLSLPRLIEGMKTRELRIFMADVSLTDLPSTQQACAQQKARVADQEKRAAEPGTVQVKPAKTPVQRLADAAQALGVEVGRNPRGEQLLSWTPEGWKPPAPMPGVLGQIALWLKEAFELARVNFRAAERIARRALERLGAWAGFPKIKVAVSRLAHSAESEFDRRSDDGKRVDGRRTGDRSSRGERGSGGWRGDHRDRGRGVGRVGRTAATARQTPEGREAGDLRPAGSRTAGGRTHPMRLLPESLLGQSRADWGMDWSVLDYAPEREWADVDPMHWLRVGDPRRGAEDGRGPRRRAPGTGAHDSSVEARRIERAPVAPAVESTANPVRDPVDPMKGQPTIHHVIPKEPEANPPPRIDPTPMGIPRPVKRLRTAPTLVPPMRPTRPPEIRHFPLQRPSVETLELIGRQPVGQVPEREIDKERGVVYLALPDPLASNQKIWLMDDRGSPLIYPDRRSAMKDVWELQRLTDRWQRGEADDDRMPRESDLEGGNGRDDEPDGSRGGR